jgi:hypothetical protein
MLSCCVSSHVVLITAPVVFCPMSDGRGPQAHNALTYFVNAGGVALRGNLVSVQYRCVDFAQKDVIMRGCGCCSIHKYSHEGKAHVALALSRVFCACLAVRLVSVPPEPTRTIQPALLGRAHDPPSKILLCSFADVNMVVNIDEIEAAFALYGPLAKLVLFDKRRTGMQSFIEFFELSDAIVAQHALDGQVL